MDILPTRTTVATDTVDMLDTDMDTDTRTEDTTDTTERERPDSDPLRVETSNEELLPVADNSQATHVF